MERYSYLWGTQGKNYCEIGRADRLDAMLRNLGTTNPELALDEVKQMFFGFHTLPGYGDQKQPPLNVRYAPVYLNKKPFYALRQMQPMAALCVNGLEKAGGSRESVYSYLTLISREELLAPGSFSVVDQLFGGQLLTAEEEEKHKLGTQRIDFARPLQHAAVPSLQGAANKEIRRVCIRTVWELYKGADRRIVIRIEKEAPFLERAMEILKGIYSLIPAKLAADTGFSVYERPENIADCIAKLNTRIFILPEECQVDQAMLGENVLLIDCVETVSQPEVTEEAAEQEKNSDYQHVNDAYRDELLSKLAVYMRAGDGGPSQDTEALLTRWCELPWEKRLPVLAAVFADESSYLNKEEYVGRLAAFFDNDFFRWEKEEKIRLSYGDDVEALVKETVALYKEYRSFPICRAIGWTKDAFAMQIENILTEGHTIEMLLNAMNAYNTRVMTPEAHRKCEVYAAWLGDMGRRAKRRGDF